MQTGTAEADMDPNNPYETWQAVIEKIKSYGTVNPAQVDAFLGRMQPQASSTGFLLATVDTDFIKGQIEKRFLNYIESALLDLFKTEYQIEIEVDSSSSTFAQQAASKAAEKPQEAAQPQAPSAAEAEPNAPAAESENNRETPSVPAVDRRQKPDHAQVTGSQIAAANGTDIGAAALTF